MVYLGFDRRCMLILEDLSKRDDFITLDSLAQKINQSRRSTQYDIYKINNIFKTLGLQKVKSKPNAGIMLLEEHKKWFSEFARKEKDNVDYIFTQDERMALIICENILSDSTMTIEQMAEKLMVSRNTINSDIRLVKAALESYNLIFEYVFKKGYKIKGDPLKALSLFMYYMSKLYPLIDEGILDYKKNEEVQENIKKLEDIGLSLHAEYKQKNIEKLALLMMFYKDKREIPQLHNHKIFSSEVYKLVEANFSGYSVDLKLYIAVFLLGMRLPNDHIDFSESPKQYSIYAEHLVNYFEQLIDMRLKNRETLIFNLAKHLSKAIYRYKLGLFDIDMDINKKIENDFKEVFELVKIAANKFAKDIGYPINDTEIMYLTIYFAAHMKRHNTEVKKVPVMLVTKGSARELIRKINDELPMFHIAGSVKAEEFQGCNDSSMIIISTQLLKYKGFYAYISDELSKNDKKKILELYLNYHRMKTENEGQSLFDTIKKYVYKEHLNDVKKEIEKYFFMPIPNLMQLLEQEYVQCVDEISEWKDAMAQGALPLLENSCINKHYIDSMIANIDIYGCYTYMGNHVYIAHAKSCGNVKHSSVAVLSIRNGVLFPDGNVVKLLIIIASVDKYEHFSVLKEAVKICNDNQKIQQLMQCDDEYSLYCCIKEISSTE